MSHDSSALRHARPRPQQALPTPAQLDPPRFEVPNIVVGFDEEAVGDAGIAALATCPELFVHGEELVTVVPTARPGVSPSSISPLFRIAKLPTPRLRELLSRSARWIVPQADTPGQSAVSRVPQWVVAAIAARRHWPGLRRLTAVVNAPVLRPDGTILASPGYDPPTGLYFAPPEHRLDLPERPSRLDALKAVRALLGTVSHVPFSAVADRAAWLAMVLTPLARFALNAPSPLCLIEDAPNSRWSDELITDLAAIAGARPPATLDAEDVLTSAPQAVDALRRNGEGVATITNSATRSSASWRRVHEALERAQATSGFVWLSAATRRARDPGLARYALTARCECSVEAPPDEGESPQHLSPSEKLVAGLTILRAYQVAGCPNVGLPRWVGFERWSQFVRAAVVWSGLPDPVSPSVPMEAPTDATEAAVADLLVGWSELAPSFPGGCSTRQALDAVSQAPSDRYPRLRAALAVFAPGRPDDRSTADRLGRALTRFRDEQHEGVMLVRVGSGNQGNRWAIRSVATTD